MGRKMNRKNRSEWNSAGKQMRFLFLIHKNRKIYSSVRFYEQCTGLLFWCGNPIKNSFRRPRLRIAYGEASQSFVPTKGSMHTSKQLTYGGNSASASQKSEIRSWVFAYPAVVFRDVHGCRPTMGKWGFVCLSFLLNYCIVVMMNSERGLRDLYTVNMDWNPSERRENNDGWGRWLSASFGIGMGSFGSDISVFPDWIEVETGDNSEIVKRVSCF